VLRTEIDGGLKLSSGFLPFLVHCRTPAVGQFCETSDIKQEKLNRRSTAAFSTTPTCHLTATFGTG
jgi:hypothetical protein